MKRRGFIKVMAAGSAVALTPAVLSGCSSSEVEYKPVENDHQDIRLKLISHAMLAPNSHNIQPWLIKLKGNDAFELFVDQTRLLPYTDPPARQIHISQGTFLETLNIAASGMGYRVKIDYFPRGEYTNQTIEENPVAAVQLISDPQVKTDPFYNLLKVRQSNKRSYEDKPVPESVLKLIREEMTQAGIVTRTSASSALRSKLTPILGKGMAIEATDRARNKETADMFRFSEAEAVKYRDGFTVANNGMTGFMRWMAETFFLGTKEEAYAVDSAFAKEAVKMTYKQAETATAYGWIISEKNTRFDQVKSGHIYARINLLTAKLGLAQHPMSQVLQEYEDMNELQQECLQLLGVPKGSTVQMLFRLGYADTNPHTKRRPVKDVLV